MATIANLTLKADGSYEGNLATLSVTAPIAIVPNCQTAFKGDPRSASKRDPLFGYDVGLLKMALRCARRRAGVARPEARAAQDRFLKAPKVAVSCGF
ncbi:hypothetical protein [Sphingopyxis sp.]|jgi:hypothetical protein|uniref:hypothetical protein n=1 Tax=Sphingopyxis sp. TaxID=1908224 RepID=UPI003F72854D